MRFYRKWRKSCRKSNFRTYDELSTRTIILAGHETTASTMSCKSGPIVMPHSIAWPLYITQGYSSSWLNHPKIKREFLLKFGIYENVLAQKGSWQPVITTRCLSLTLLSRFVSVLISCIFYWHRTHWQEALRLHPIVSSRGARKFMSSYQVYSFRSWFAKRLPTIASHWNFLSLPSPERRFRKSLLARAKGSSFPLRCTTGKALFDLRCCQQSSHYQLIG